MLRATLYPPPAVPNLAHALGEGLPPPVFSAQKGTPLPPLSSEILSPPPPPVPDLLRPEPALSLSRLDLREKIGRRFEATAVSDELKSSFTRKLMAYRVVDDAGAQILHRAGDRLLSILELESHEGGTNSLFEYLTYQVFEAVTMLGGQETFDSLMAFLADDYSLRDLVLFVSRAHIGGHFKLILSPEMNVPSIVQAFVETVRYKKRSSAYAPGISSPAYQLGERDLVDVFAAALHEPTLKSEVGACLFQAASGPLPFLQLNRLFHILMNRNYFYKMSEFTGFPWEASRHSFLDTASYFSSPAIDGTIDTGFLKGPHLADAFSHLMSVCQGVNEVTLADRRQRLVDYVDKNSELFSASDDKGLTKALVALLRRQPSHHSLSLASEIEDKKVEVKWKTREEMQAHVQRTLLDIKPVRDIGVGAYFIRPEKNNGIAAIGLLRPLKSEMGNALNRFRKAPVRGVHERRHIDQVDRWTDLLPMEMEAYATDMAFRLINGDADRYRSIERLSPFGFPVGLRNMVEQIYFRKRALPRPLFP